MQKENKKKVKFADKLQSQFVSKRKEKGFISQRLRNMNPPPVLTTNSLE
jgi:hypothetical protein